MPYRPIDKSLSERSQHKQSQSTPSSDTQHGLHHISILLDIPSESLTHVTSFLDPVSLFRLSRACKYLHAHVEDDNTWHRAFVYQFLGVGPESDVHNAKTLMLRRSESSWRREFVFRYSLRRRWGHPRNRTVTHTPHHSPVTGMHLMAENALLTSSLQYGIVSRSIPLVGKVLRGYLDAAGTGLGIGNPNLEFTPNVSTCALASDGGTAKIIWGFRNGEVAVTTSGRAMDSNRAAAKLVRCKVEDQHEGSVQNAVWDAGLSIFVTGAVDGRVKIWDAKRVSCIWTLDPNASLLAPNPCQKVVSDLARGLVVAALSTGEIIVWSGLASLLSEDTTRPSVIETRIPPPRHDAGSSASRDIFGLYIDARVSSHVSILAIHSNDPHFYRFRIDISSMHIETTTYGNASFGPISAIKPVFASQERHHSFIIVGDQLGCVSIYQWDAPPSPTAQPIQAFRKFEAHDDGAVTSIAFDSVVLATGSARGTIALFESLTLERLRIIAGPSPRYADRVSKIILQREVLVASIGPNVTAIKAGVVGKDKASGKGKSSRAKQTGAHKWHQQLELNHAIKESRAALEEEQRYRHKVFGREKEQHSTLENLGLDEVEAVEYVLMLSRDDEERRRMNSGPSFPSSSGSGPGEGDDMFEDDFDDAYASTSTHARSSADSRRSSMSQSTDRSLPRVSPSISNLKVQVSPRFRPEPTEAGFSISPLNASAGPSSGVMIPPSSDAFPRVSPTQSPATSVPNGSWVRKPSLPSSPESMRSAWGTARRSAASSETHSPVSGSPLMSRGTWGASGHDQNNMLPEDEELDEDLRFAIQLSLAEARSRGEDV